MNVIRTGKLSDKELVGILNKLFQIAPEGSATVSFAGGLNKSVSATDGLTQIPSKPGDHLIERFNFSFEGSPSDRVEFARGISRETGPNPNTSYTEQQLFGFRAPNAYFDEIAFFTPTQHGPGYVKLSDEDQIKVVRLIGKFQAQVQPSGNAEEFTAAIHANVEQLQRVTIDFLDSARASQEREQRIYQGKLQDLDKAHSMRMAELESQESELQKRRDELNDREPQHERRRLRESLTGELKGFVKNPPARASNREWISNISYVAVGAFFVIVSAYLTAIKIAGADSGTAAFWTVAAKSITAGIVGAAFMWAGLAGMRATAKAGREFEQQLQRYAFDMDRASWIVETLLQMSATESAQVPDEWLQSVCRDLFLVGGEKDHEARSLDAFAALFDATARAKIGTSGIEFEIDRKGAKKLAREGA